MLSEAQLIDSPVDTAMDVLAKAFNPNGRHRKEALRVIKQVLRLARERGFTQAELFFDFFRQDPKTQNPRILRRLLLNLFEFVSADEFVQLSRRF